jgi:hypothetical protein
MPFRFLCVICGRPVTTAERVTVTGRRLDAGGNGEWNFEAIIHAECWRQLARVFRYPIRNLR